MSEAESNTESPKPSPPKTDDEKNEADEELSVGSPGVDFTNQFVKFLMAPA
jgi:hypothetical protein